MPNNHICSFCEYVEADEHLESECLTIVGYRFV
jgi:hypothetical protein